MLNVDYITKENIKDLKSNWLEIPDNPYRISISERTGPG